MCETEIITFDGGANFLVAKGATPGETALFNVVRSMIIDAAAVPSVEGDYFGQVTDDPTAKPLLLHLLGVEDIPVIERTPEDLVAQGFSEEAVVRGLEAARPLSAVA